MLKAVSSIVVVASLASMGYIFRDAFNHPDENFGVYSRRVIKENQFSIFAYVITAIVALLTASFFEKKRFQEENTRLNCTPRIKLESYKKYRKLLTKKAVLELTKSEEYKKYLEAKANGTLKPIQLDEDDKIVLSDDSDVDEPNVANNTNNAH